MKGERFQLGIAFAVAALLVAASAPNAADDQAIRLTETTLNGAEMKYGQAARQRLVAWLDLIEHSQQKSAAEKLELVNNFFNRIPFVPDMEHWGRRDYWATPVELLASNGGDCEDYSTGKYFTLLALGVEVDRLRITYVKAKTRDPAIQAHMVLTYYPVPDATPLVLDNLDKEIKPASERGDLTPVYSFNGNGLWLSSERNSGRRLGGSSQIDLWAELNARINRGF
jgi:predicted transglutaminase-like cysteine proteinase